MKKQTIVLIIICLALIGIIIYMHTKYENKKQESENLVNLSISAEYNNKLIKTGFDVNGIQGNTSGTTSYEIINMQKQWVVIKNVNIENQNFYVDEISFNLTENKRIDLTLDKPFLPNITILEDGKNNITINVNSSNFKEVNFCLVGSLNYLFLTAVNFTEMSKPSNFTNYDVCYNGKFSLIGDNKTIEITYMPLGNPTKFDYINISIFDKANNVKIERIK